MPQASNAAEGRELSVRGLTHSYGGQNAISDISFEIKAGEIVALLGPSGCGKSTVLRAIAGLIQPKSGLIQLGGQDLANVSARARGIGMVFQNCAVPTPDGGREHRLSARLPKGGAHRAS